MWRTDLFRALALSAFLLWLLTGDADRSPGIVGIALLLGLAAPFFDNAKAAALPQIVPGSRLEVANALTQVSASVGGQLLGPALGAALVVLDPTWPMAFDAVSFLAAALLVAMAARIRPRIGPPERSGESPQLRSDLRQGWAALMDDRALRACSVLIALSNALVAGATAVLVLYVVDVLRLPEASFGLFVAVMAAGGIAGALLAPALIARLGQRRLLRHGLLLGAAGFLAAAATTRVPLVLGSIATAGAGLLAWNVAAVSYRQRVVPARCSAVSPASIA
ncbi:MAG: MFS transporter [Micrococcales bacterium]|nr:MFS transporter [Micrococcales bacterium]